MYSDYNSSLQYSGSSGTRNIGYPILVCDAILPVEGVINNRRPCKFRGLISRDKHLFEQKIKPYNLIETEQWTSHSPSCCKLEN